MCSSARDSIGIDCSVSMLWNRLHHCFDVASISAIFTALKKTRHTTTWQVSHQYQSTVSSISLFYWWLLKLKLSILNIFAVISFAQSLPSKLKTCRAKSCCQATNETRQTLWTSVGLMCVCLTLPGIQQLHLQWYIINYHRFLSITMTFICLQFVNRIRKGQFQWTHHPFVR